MKKDEFIELCQKVKSGELSGMEWDGQTQRHVLAPCAMRRIRELAEAALELYEKKSGTDAEYPYNLIEDVFGYDTFADGWSLPEELRGELSEDQERGLEYALSTLTERERGCLGLMYRDGKTLRQIGAEYGVTQERIRQVVAKALRKLRHPTRNRYIKAGYSCASGEVYQKEMRAHESEIERARAAAEKAIADYNAVVKGKTPPSTKEMTLEELELSVRSFNCLRRYGVHTVRDILALDGFDELFRIRNLGRRSCEEVLAKLRALGYTHFANGKEM